MSFSIIGRKVYIATQIVTPILSFTSLTDTTVTVNWTSEPGATNYVLQRSPVVDFSTGVTTLFNGLGLTFNDTGLTASTHYYYRIKATGIGYIDSAYGADSITTSGGAVGLSTPAVIRLGYGLHSISMIWGAISGATGYEVQRSTDGTFATGVVALYTGNAAGVTQVFQPGYTLEYHDSGLAPATIYNYRVRATGTGAPSAWSPTRTFTTGSANKTATVTGPTQIIVGGETEFDWYDGSTVQHVHGGDTVAVAMPTSGYWQYMVWQNFNATPTERLHVRNQGDLKMVAGMSFLSCSFIDIDGSHSSKTLPQGIYVEGTGGGSCFEINGLSHDMTFKYIKTRGASYAMRLKNEANSFVTSDPDCGIQFQWPSHLHDFEIAYWDSKEHSQDGIYFGSSGPWGGRTFTCAGVTVNYRPTGLANIHVHHNEMHFCGRSGYQIGCMDLGTNTFHDNNISECGFEYAVDQGAGMAVGGANNSLEIYNNNISRTFRESLYTYNYGQMYFHDNITNDAGIISVDPLRVYFWTKINLTTGQTLDPAWMNSSPGKTIMDSMGEYFFEFFVNESGNPVIKTQRIANAESTTEFAIPTTHPTSVSLTIQTGRTYAVGQVVRVVNQIDKTKWFKMTVTSYNAGSGLLIGDSNSNTGTGTYRVWVVYKENRLPEDAIAAIGQVAPGSHAGSQLDPFAGFGASSPILASQVSYPTEISIPGSQAVGSFMMNPFSHGSIDYYGTPAGLSRFRIENNQFGTQHAASNSVIKFNNSWNLYGTGNTICGNTYLGSPLLEANITKPAGGVVTYTLSSACL